MRFLGPLGSMLKEKHQGRRILRDGNLHTARQTLLLLGSLFSTVPPTMRLSFGQTRSNPSRTDTAQNGERPVDAQQHYRSVQIGWGFCCLGHRILFKVYTLDEVMKLGNKVTKDKLLDSIEGMEENLMQIAI